MERISLSLRAALLEGAGEEDKNLPQSSLKLLVRNSWGSTSSGLRAGLRTGIFTAHSSGDFVLLKPILCVSLLGHDAGHPACLSCRAAHQRLNQLQALQDGIRCGMH